MSDLRDRQPITLLVCALGGEGGGVLSEWLVEAATLAGYGAQSTSIPGVAQRTGATTYYIEVFPEPEASLGGRRPVFGLAPVAGALDALVSSELLETVRQIGFGLVSPERTLVLTHRGRTLTTLEKMGQTDGRVSGEQLTGFVRRYSRAAHLIDMQEIAQRTGTVVSAVMLGAIAGSGLLPVARSAFEAAIRASGKGVEASQRGFAAAFEAVAAAAAPVQVAREAPKSAAATGLVGKGSLDASMARVRAALSSAHAAASSSRDAAPTAGAMPSLPQDESLPPRVREFAALGAARVREYQGPAYEALYRRRLARIVLAEREADPQDAHASEVARETARWLALWMAFDDIVQVARLKSRAARWQRVRAEVKAAPEEIVRVFDFFKPGAAEIAGLLPPALARRVLAWDRRRIAAGKEPLGFRLRNPLHRVRGLLLLRLLGGLGWLRPRGSRYREEQAMIESWLQRIERGLGADWALGHEIALCGRLIKGYGSTNERGRANLAHILAHLADGAAPPAERARGIALARAAAFADDAGNALDRQLGELGAPPRPVEAQPIRWVRNGAARAAPTRTAG